MEKVPLVLYPPLQSPCILCDQGPLLVCIFTAHPVHKSAIYNWVFVGWLVSPWRPWKWTQHGILVKSGLASHLMVMKGLFWVSMVHFQCSMFVFAIPLSSLTAQHCASCSAYMKCCKSELSTISASLGKKNHQDQISHQKCGQDSLCCLHPSVQGSGTWGLGQVSPHSLQATLNLFWLRVIGTEGRTGT